MKPTLFLCLLLGKSYMIVACDAAPKDDAIRDFVGSVIRSFDNQSDFPDPSEFDAPLPPKGGYLTQFEFDVTEDGVPELFLSASLVDGYRAQKKYSVYEIKNGTFKELGSDLQIISSFGVIKNEDALTIVSLTGTTRWGQTLIRQFYHFKKSGSFTRDDVKINAEEYQKISNQADQNANNGTGDLQELLLGTKYIVTIERAKQLLLVSYLSDQASKWSPMNYVSGYGLLLDRAVYTTNSDGSGYKDPELDNDRKSASDCTLLAARSWLKSLNNEERSNQKTNQTSTPRLPRSLQPHGARPMPAPLSDEPTSLTPLIALVFVMMTGVSVLLWLFLKNRK